VNKKQSQSGNTHLVIIIVLVVLLIGALGFVYYQNFIQSNNSSKSVASTKTVKSSTVAAKPEVTTNEGYLTFSEWGIKLKTPVGLADNRITYYKIANNSELDGYNFSTSRVEAQGGACSSSSPQFSSLGIISRSTSPNTEEASPPTLVGKIGDYYYYYAHPQSICGDNLGNYEVQDTSMIQTMLLSVEKL
jgi:hypothetical protein